MNRREYTTFETRLGFCGIAWQEAEKTRGGLAVVSFQLPEKTERLTARRIADKTSAGEARKIPPQIKRIIKKIQNHFVGKGQDFSDVEVYLGGAGSFAKEVYAAARKIPAGRTMTYGELAEAIKRPKAARAVGQAMAKNPIPLIIPCHRVVAAGNRPGGYSAPGGINTKANILAIEGATISNDWLPENKESD